MGSTDARVRIEAAFDKLDAAARRCFELSFDGLTVPELCQVLEWFELFNGRLAALQYELTSPFSRRSSAPKTH
jgi:hypothetical protein